MGLILDSTAVISGEREGMTARAMLEDVGRRAGEQEVALSVVTVLELAHGVARADTAERRSKRQRFLDELLRVVPVQPVTVSIALLAGRIDGEQQSKGTRIALADLLIGASALELGYAVGTANARHFQLIPGVNVVNL